MNSADDMKAFGHLGIREGLPFRPHELDRFLLKLNETYPEETARLLQLLNRCGPLLADPSQSLDPLDNLVTLEDHLCGSGFCF